MSAYCSGIFGKTEWTQRTGRHPQVRAADERHDHEHEAGQPADEAAPETPEDGRRDESEQDQVDHRATIRRGSPVAVRNDRRP